MKVGFRRPSLRKRIAARTSIKRMIRSKVGRLGNGLADQPSGYCGKNARQVQELRRFLMRKLTRWLLDRLVRRLQFSDE